MSTDPQRAPRPLPERSNLRHLKDQARDLLKSGAATSITDAQFQIARLYGFASWPKLKAHVESFEENGQLKQAIDTNDLVRVKSLMTRNPALHRAPLGYGEDGPLTWVAECRVPWEPPSPARLAIAEWMITHGSDVHQGGDGPLMRAALSGYRIPMMELLVSHKADVNAQWHGHFPIIFAPCESIDPAALKWLLDHGANPNCRNQRHEISGHSYPGTALDYLIASYGRSLERLSACIDILIEAGGKTKYDAPAVLALLRGRLDNLGALIDAEPGLVNKHFPELDCGQTGGRLLLLQGGTLLHVAAEYRNIAAVTLLLDRGADVNARAAVNEAGIGGQTAIFHAVTQSDDGGLLVTQLLLDSGADLTLRVKLPGDYERPEEIVDCTALGYALRFGGDSQRRTVALLREWGAVE
ncbi:MAG TPA: ankyrin repeat domain-containing protein [Candidatus Acidoferrum sp.]|nr:ankyrin repeat domain-containing protein [Candidatus Acidoferrum sp.]